MSKIPISPRRLKIQQSLKPKTPQKQDNVTKITLIRNDSDKIKVKNYEFTSINKIFSDSLVLLQLSNNPTTLFNEYGTKITLDDEIKHKSKIYVSCGEPFCKTVVPVIPEKKAAPVVEEEKPVQETQPEVYSPFADFLKDRKEKEKQQEEEKEKLEQTKKVVKEEKEEIKIPDELKILPYLVILSTMPYEERYKVPYSEMLLKKLRDYQLELISDHLTRAGFLNTLSNKFIIEKVNEIAINSTNEMKLNEIQIVFTGGKFSGKTAIAKEAALNVYRKIQLSNTPDSILFVPLNFSKVDFMNPDSIFLWMADSIISALEYCVIPLTPFYLDFKELFYGILDSPTIPVLNANIASIPSLNAKMLNKIMKKLYESYHNRDGLLEFVTETINLPISIAQAFNLSTFLLIDTVSLCSVEISKCSKFPDYIKSVNIEEIFRTMLQTTSYIIANEDAFNLDAIDIQTYDLIEYEAKTISIDFSDISNGQVSSESLVLDHYFISSDECEGCPGYLDMFISLLDSVADYESKKVQDNNKHCISMIDRSKEMKIRTQMLKLLQVINSDGVFSDLMNMISTPNRMKFEIE